jgi:phage terminase small subunit
MQARFAHEYAIDLSPSRAARRAGYKDTKNITITAANLMRLPKIKAAIAKHAARIAKKIDLDAATVLTELWNIARADANDLIQHRIGACRHCYGVGFKYLETPKERVFRELEYAKNMPHWLKQRERAPLFEIPPFDERGGVGYDRTRPPNAHCPECNGIGAGYAWAVDTRTLKNGARSIYAGVKETKDGIEIKMHSKERALELLGDHFGLFKQAAPPPGAPVTNNTQNNLYAISTADLYKLLAGKLSGGNPAPGTGES